MWRRDLTLAPIRPVQLIHAHAGDRSAPVPLDVAATALAAAAIAVAWVLVGDALNQRQPDLAVYLYADQLGDALYSANVVLDERMPAGGLPFTYTPFGSLAFAPMRLLPIGVAIWVWALLNAAAILLAAWLVFRDRRSWRIAAALVTLLTAISAAHIMMGQVNAVLMLLVLSDFVPDRYRPRWLPAGVGTGLAAAVKLTPAIVIAYFLVTRRWRAAAVAGGTAAAANFVGWLALPQSTAEYVGLLPQL